MLKFISGNELAAGAEPEDLSQTKLKSTEQMPWISIVFVLSSKYLLLVWLNEPCF